jgi:hypothetical protein
MQDSGPIQRVLLYPRSGYLNRLQAMASSSILARRLGAEFRVCWETEGVVPEGPELTFDPEFIAELLLPVEIGKETWDRAGTPFPRYLKSIPHEHLIVLSGHDRGEQALMSDLRQAVAEASFGSTLLISAGGKFFLDCDESVDPGWEDFFRTQRHEYYSHMELHPSIEDAANDEVRTRGPFIGLHLRYTDRSHQTPFDRSITKAVLAASRASNISDIFIASDSRAMRDKWVELVSRMGLTPWSRAHSSWDRSTSGSGHAALVDWRILTRAERLVYFAESTFAEEAAVASSGYHRSYPLASSAMRSALVRSQTLGRDFISFPQRHGWPRRTTGD